MGNPIGRVYTIGYSGFSLNDFVEVLKKLHIQIVIDVRSLPVSKHFSDYNKDFLEKVLKENHIHYRNYSSEFGARQTESCYFSDEGYLDFVKFTSSSQFKQGLSKIEAGISAGYNFALMCAEKNPSMCHRTIMVARQFFNNGIEVIHIMPNNRLLSQSDIENELLDHYFPDRNQISLLSDLPTREELINHAYQKRNQEIGFRDEEGDS